MEEWAGLYKLARLAVFAAALVGITIYLYAGKRRERLERPALRMLEEDDES